MGKIRALYHDNDAMVLGQVTLAHGDPCRLGRLRLYGDAINVEVAKAFIEATIEAIS